MGKTECIRVLLVDDEERFRINATATLERRGFEVFAVGNGDEAIDHVRRGDFGVVVLDLKMPGMDGNEVLRKIKKLQPDLGVIMLTGNTTLASAVEALNDDVFAYLSKPCDIDLLAQMIRDAFAKARGFKRDYLSYSKWAGETGED